MILNCCGPSGNDSRSRWPSVSHAQILSEPLEISSGPLRKNSESPKLATAPGIASSRVYRHKRIECYIRIEHVSCLLACVEHLRNLSCFLRFSTLWVCSGSVQNDTLKSVAKDFSTYSPTSRMCVRSSGEQLRPAHFRAPSDGLFNQLF